MVLLRKQLKLNLLAAAAAALPALAMAAGWVPPFGYPADSTTNHVISVGVPLPPPCDATCIKGVVGKSLPGMIGPAGTGVPVGYTEIKTAMANRYLGTGAFGLAAAGYYYGLNYGPIPLDHMTVGQGQAPAPSINNVATGTANLTASGVPYGPPPQGSVVVVSEWSVDAQGGSGVTGFDYYVIEPQGTRSTLQKVTGSTLLNLAPADVNAYALAGTVGVNTGTSSRICQSKGYTDYTPGTITATYAGSGCNSAQLVTQWNGAGWVSDTACYNYIMSGVQCWK